MNKLIFIFLHFLKNSRNACGFFLAPAETRAEARVLIRSVHRKITQASACVSVGARTKFKCHPEFLRRYIFFATIILFGALLLSGCSKDHKAEKDVAAFIQRTEQIAKSKKQEQEQAEKPITAYVYTGDQLRDPFDRSENVVIAKRHDNSILSDVSLDDLKLVGTVLRKENSWAIVRGSDGKLYRLMNGVHVGVQQAQVIDIKQGEIVLKTAPELGLSEKSNDIVMKIQE